MKTFLILLLPFLLFSDDSNSTQNFEKLIVKGTQEASIFEAQGYIEAPNYLQDAPSQQRLTMAEAMNMPGVMGDPIKAVKVLAGVTSTGSSGQMIIHASKSSETLYTVNYLPLGYLFHFQGLHSVISPEATDQLDIYLGGFDTTYNNAMGGVLDITPKYPSGDNGGFAHVGIFDASFGFDAKLGENTSLYIGGRRSYFELFSGLLTRPRSASDSNLTVSITQFPQYWDGTLFLTHRIKEHTLSLEVIAAEDAFGAVINGNVQRPEANGPLDTGTGFTTTGLRWRYDGEDYQANTLAYYLKKYERFNIFNWLKRTADEQNTGLKHISTFEIKEHKITTGFSLNRYYIPLNVDVNISDPSIQLNSSYPVNGIVNQTLDLYMGDLFAQDVYTFNEIFKLRYGATYTTSLDPALRNNIDPRLAVIINAGEKDIVSLSTGIYSQKPTGTSMLEQIGNPQLTYERSYHLNLSYKHLFGDSHTLTIEPYIKQFEHLAISDKSSNPSLNYLSVGKGDGKGVDVTYNYQSDRLYLLASYTYVQARRQLDSADDALYTFKSEIPNTLNIVASFKANDAWTLSTLLKYQNGPAYTPVISVVDVNGTFIPTYGNPYSARLGDYFTLNLKASYVQRLSRGKKIEYAFELMNVTNHDNPLSIRWSTIDNSSTISYDLPLLPWFDITYRF